MVNAGVVTLRAGVYTASNLLLVRLRDKLVEEDNYDRDAGMLS